MNFYNHGYGQNILINLGDSRTNQNEAGRQLGSATIIDIPLPSGAVSAGFYAIAYQWNGGTVISYRGTNYDDVGGYSQLRDIWNGWIVGAGAPEWQTAGREADGTFRRGHAVRMLTKRRNSDRFGAWNGNPSSTA